MTRRVYTEDNGGETARAREAYRRYRDLGPARSLEKLCDRFAEEARAHQTDPTIPLPPSTNLDTLKGWSARWLWQARIAAWQAEQDYTRRQEMLKQAQAQARQNAQLMQSVGAGALGVCIAFLNSMVDPKTGQVIGDVSPRDVPPLMKAGAELLQLSTGNPTAIIQSGMDTVQLEGILRECDDDTRKQITDGMKAALAWEVKQGRP